MNEPDQYRWTGDATRDAVPVAYRYLPYAPGGNIGMWRDVFETVGGFDEQLLRAEDIDFGWRAAYLGIPVAIEPAPCCTGASVPTRTPSSAPRSAAASPRPACTAVTATAGCRATTTSDVLEQYRWLLKSVPAVMRGTTDRYQWAHHAGKRLGRLVGSARERDALPVTRRLTPRG